ncbi:MAG: acyl-CoA dehydrogenase family protein [Pseudomonadota bacterium]
MDFSLSEEQIILKDMAKNFLAKECPKSLVKEIIKDEKGYSPAMWSKMAELGWMGFIFPEKYGGMEGSFLDLTVLIEEMGRACLPSPFFSTVILGGLSILEGGNDDQKDTFLPRIANGEIILTLAITEASASYEPDGIETRFTKTNEGYTIDGTKLFVSDANIADYIIVAARAEESEGNDGIALFIADIKSPGITVTPLHTISEDNQCEVRFEGVKVKEDALIGGLNNGWSIVQKLWPKMVVARCAEMVGGAQEALDMTINYAKEREQFGRPIGTLQAVQHFCSDMVADVDGCRYLTYQAAWTISCGLPCDKEVAMAKAWCSDAFKRVTAKGHQIHGAIGFTEEHDLHLYYKKAKTLELLYGDSDYHREIVAQQMGF